MLNIDRRSKLTHFIKLPFYVFIAVLSLLGLLIGCSPTNGGDTPEHNFIQKHAGSGTVTKTYRVEGEEFIDIVWLAENNIGTPEPFVAVRAQSIHGYNPSQKWSVEDHLIGEVIHQFRQQGSSTPQLIESEWTLRKLPTGSP